MILIRKMFPRLYELLSSKDKSWERNEYYINMETLLINSMFNWDCDKFPNNIPPSWIEQGLSNSGAMAFIYNGETLDIGLVGGISAIDKYGNPTEFLVSFLDGTNVTKKFDDCVIIRNNSNMTPDFNITRDSNNLSEIDLSLEYAVQNTRLAPIPVADNSVVKKAINVVLDKIRKGKEYEPIIARNNYMTDKGIEVINLTDPTSSDKMQHLSKLKDDILKNFYIMYGLPIQSVNQGSQTIKDELHAMDKVSRIYPLNRYKMRLWACEQVKEKWDIDVSVNFSDGWRHILANSSADEPDEVSADEPDDLNDVGGDENENL